MTSLVIIIDVVSYGDDFNNDRNKWFRDSLLELEECKIMVPYLSLTSTYTLQGCCCVLGIRDEKY